MGEQTQAHSSPPPSPSLEPFPQSANTAGSCIITPGDPAASLPQVDAALALTLLVCLWALHLFIRLVPVPQFQLEWRSKAVEGRALIGFLKDQTKHLEDSGVGGTTLVSPTYFVLTGCWQMSSDR
jgi:hypothetical protein